MAAPTKLKTSPKFKSITINEDKKPVLKWTKVEGAEKYGIKRALSDTGAFEHVAWTKKLEFTDEEAPADTMLRYKIQAHKILEGKKASTKMSAVKAAVISEIPAPEGLSATAEGSDRIALCWKKVEGATGYIISKRNDFYSQILPVARVNTNEYEDAGIVSGQAYHYSVQPFIASEDSERQGNFSDEVHCVNLDKGEILSARALMGKKIELKLRIVSGADGYILERSEAKDGSFTQVQKSEDITAVEFIDRVEKSIKTYYYRAVAYKTVNGAIFKSKPCEIVSVKSR